MKATAEVRPAAQCHRVISGVLRAIGVSIKRNDLKPAPVDN